MHQSQQSVTDKPSSKPILHEKGKVLQSW